MSPECSLKILHPESCGRCLGFLLLPEGPGPWSLRGVCFSSAALSGMICISWACFLCLCSKIFWSIGFSEGRCAGGTHSHLVSGNVFILSSVLVGSLTGYRIAGFTSRVPRALEMRC